MNRKELEQMSVVALRELGRALSIPAVAKKRKAELVTAILAQQPDEAKNVVAERPEPGLATQPSNTTPSATSGPATSAAPRLSDLGELPASYGETRITLLTQKPGHLYTYWEVRDDDLSGGRQRLAAPDAKMILRACEATNGDFFDIEIHCPVGDWFFQIQWSDQAVYVEIGLRAPDGRFLSLATSNEVISPSPGPSSRVDPEWAIRDAEFKTIYRLSGGNEIGSSSGSVQRTRPAGNPPSQEAHP